MRLGNYITTYLIILTVFVSCGGKQIDDRPENLIEKEVFTEMILEMQLIEAHLNEVRVDQSIIRDSANNYFQEVFEKHGTSFEDFSNTMDYYASQPEELQGIYDKVLDILSHMEVELIDVKMDQDAISPLGKKQMINLISHLRLAPIYIDSSFNSEQTKDSLFRYIAANPSLFDSLPYNMESFQKSYIGLTFNNVRYLSFREEIKQILDSLDKN